METQSQRRLPVRLWLIVVLQGLLMLATTVIYPPFQEPDEAAQIDYVLAHREGVWLAGPGERPLQSGVVAASGLIPDTSVTDHIASTAPVPRGQRLSFDALGTAPSTTSLPDQMVQHPFLYYGVAAGFSYLLPDFSRRGFDVQIFWLRLMSLLLLLPVPLLIFTAARRVTGSVDLALVAAVIPLSIPSYLRTGASVTNDSMLVLVCTALLAVVVRIAWGDLSRRTSLLAGVLLGAALLTKGFALALPIVLVGAYLVGACPGSFTSRLRQTWPPMTTSIALGGALGGWWWVRNVILYGAVQPDGYGALPANLQQAVSGSSTPKGSELRLVPAFAEVILRHLWGSLGLIDTPSLPIAVLLTVSIGAVILVVVSCLHHDEQTGWEPKRAAVLNVAILLTLAILYVGVRHSYLNGRHLPGLQARYLVPDLLGPCIAIAVALGRIFARARRWLAPALLTGSLAFLAVSTLLVFDVEMSAPNASFESRLRSSAHFVTGWAPWSAPVTASIAIALIVTTAVTVVAFWAGARRADGDRTGQVAMPRGVLEAS